MAGSSRTIDELAQEFQSLSMQRDTHRVLAERDRVFSLLMRRIEPQCSRLVRRYGLLDLADDAHQACAIGLFRALQSFDSDKASFSTHATWQLRGELQSLRHRMRLDQRQSARKAGVRTVALESLGARDDAASEAFEVVDDAALDSIERAASDALTINLTTRLLERLNAPDHERTIMMEHLFDSHQAPESCRKIREQRRQIVRRTFRNCMKLVAA